MFLEKYLENADDSNFVAFKNGLMGDCIDRYVIKHILLMA